MDTDIPPGAGGAPVATPMSATVRDDLRRACGRLLAGIAFIVLDLTIGPLDLLHDAIGFGLALSAIAMLRRTVAVTSAADERLRILRGLALVGVAVAIVATFVQARLSPPADLVLGLYDDLVVLVTAQALLAVVVTHGLGRAAASWTSTRTIATTTVALVLVAIVPVWLVPDGIGWLAGLVAAIAGLVALVHLCVSLVRTRREVRLAPATTAGSVPA